MGLTDTGLLKKAAKTTSLRRRIHCDVILPHNGSQKKLAAKSRFGDWPQ